METTKLTQTQIINMFNQISNNYNVKVDVPIQFSNKLSKAYAYVAYDKNKKPISINLSEQLLDANIETINDVLLQQLLFYINLKK